MKIIISESQNELLAEKIKSSLEEYFSDIVDNKGEKCLCGFKVYVNDDEDYELSGVRYDIHIIFSAKNLSRFNSLGINNLRVRVSNQVREFMRNFIPVKFGITTQGKYCD